MLFDNSNLNSLEKLLEDCKCIPIIVLDTEYFGCEDEGGGDERISSF